MLSGILYGLDENVCIKMTLTVVDNENIISFSAAMKCIIVQSMFIMCDLEK